MKQEYYKALEKFEKSREFIFKRIEKISPEYFKQVKKLLIL